MIRTLLDILFPPRCVFCRRLIKGSREPFICTDCQSDLPRTHDGGRQRGNGFSLCVSPLYYEKMVRDSIHRYKFHGASAYAPTYGVLLSECVAAELTGRYDLITWTPLSKERFRERGYDQAKLLAETIAKILDAELFPTLKKIRNVQKQSLMGSPEKRRANIAGAYQAVHPERFAGKRLLLIDDVITTGATLSECAHTLRDAGAAEVLCATLCRTR